jgi:hypothetical protein
MTGWFLQKYGESKGCPKKKLQRIKDPVLGSLVGIDELSLVQEDSDWLPLFGKPDLDDAWRTRPVYAI